MAFPKLLQKLFDNAGAGPKLRNDIIPDFEVSADGTTSPRSIASRFSDGLNVKDFGAKGDGSTDDTEALKAAFTEGLKTGKVVYIPAGTYIIAGYLHVQNTNRDKNRLSIVGEGAILKSTLANTDTTFAVKFSGELRTENIALTSSVGLGDTYLDDAQLSSFRAGDLLRLRSNRLIRTDHRSHWKQGQLFEVTSVTGNRYIHLSDPTVIDVPVNSTTYTVLSGNNTDSMFLMDLSGITGGNNDDSMRYPMVCTSGANLGVSRNATNLLVSENKVYFETGWGDNTYMDDNRTPWPSAPAAGDTYQITRTAHVDRIIPIVVDMRGVTITRDRVTNRTDGGHLSCQGLQIQYGLRCVIDGCEISNFPQTALDFDTSFGCEVNNCVIRYANLIYDGINGTGHGVDVSGSRITVHNCKISECRSGITTSDKVIYTTHCDFSDIEIIGGSFLSYQGEVVYPNGDALTPYGFGGHGDLYNCSFRNVHVKDCYFGTSIRGEKILIDACTFDGEMYAAIQTSTFKDMTVSNCFAWSTEAGSGPLFAVIHVKRSNDEGEMNFINNTVTGCDNVFLRWMSSTKPIRKLTCVGNYVQYASGTSQQRFISIDRDNSDIQLSDCRFIDNKLITTGSGKRAELLFLTNDTLMETDSYIQTGANDFIVNLSAGAKVTVPSVNLYCLKGVIKVDVFTSDLTTYGTGGMYDVRTGNAANNVLFNGQALHLAKNSSDNGQTPNITLLLTSGGLVVKNNYDTVKKVVLRITPVVQ